MRRLLFFFLLAQFSAHAQYAPQAGQPGTTAISASGGGIVNWASGCTVQRGYKNIADKGLGYASSGFDNLATGAPDGDVVSLGDSGIAVMTFAHPLFDGPGADFAVFENGFKDPADPSMAFLELAFVEVSSDGEHFFRFPATSNTPVNTQIPMAGVYMDASKINNLAGKYVANYGTPFDLQEMAGISGLDISNVTHVRIVDVVGAVGGFSTYDNAGQVINDPYPSPLPTGGFDLDAVGALHMQLAGVTDIAASVPVGIYPNPATDYITVSAEVPAGRILQLSVASVTGSLVHQQQLSSGDTAIDIALYPSGIYFLTFTDEQGSKWVQKLIKR
jgi:hypothetical protein